jgi:hypothetical protein
MSYLWKGTRFSVDLLAGTGTRTTQPNGPINGASVPSWEQFNFGVTHRFDVPGAGAITLRFDVISYLLRSSTSIGAFSPAYGPWRTFFGGVSKEF